MYKIILLALQVLISYSLIDKFVDWDWLKKKGKKLLYRGLVWWIILIKATEGRHPCLASYLKAGGMLVLKIMFKKFTVKMLENCVYFNDIKVNNVFSLDRNWIDEWPSGLKLSLDIEILWAKELEDLLLVLDDNLRHPENPIHLKVFEKITEESAKEISYKCYTTGYSQSFDEEGLEKLAMSLVVISKFNNEAI